MKITKIRKPFFNLQTNWQNLCIGLAMSVQETILLNTYNYTFLPAQKNPVKFHKTKEVDA